MFFPNERGAPGISPINERIEGEGTVGVGRGVGGGFGSSRGWCREGLSLRKVSWKFRVLYWDLSKVRYPASLLSCFQSAIVQ